MVPGSRNRRSGRVKGKLPVVVLCMCLCILQATSAVPDVEMTGFRIIQETENGRWEIQADKAYYDDRGDVILQEVTARMVSDGTERVTVASDKGLYESEELILYLEGRVVVASALGSRFEAAKLKWDGPRAVMTAENGVTLQRESLKVLGTSVKYTVDSGIAQMHGNVRTTWVEGSVRP